MTATNRLLQLPQAGPLVAGPYLKIVFVLDANTGYYIPLIANAQTGEPVGVNPSANGCIALSPDPSTIEAVVNRDVLIDLNNSTPKQALYTVPATMNNGRSVRRFIPTGIIERDSAGAITTAQGSVGFDAGATNVIAADDPTTITSANDARVVPVDDPLTTGLPGNVLGYKVGTPEGAPMTMRVDVFGILIPSGIE